MFNAPMCSRSTITWASPRSWPSVTSAGYGRWEPARAGQLFGVDRPGHLVVADLDERRRQFGRGIQVERDLDVGQPQRVHGRQRVPGLLSPRGQVPQRVVDVIHPQRVFHGAQRELHVAGSALRHRDALTRLAVTALLHAPHTEEHQQTGGREPRDRRRCAR
jgi:hypothetical protein